MTKMKEEIMESKKITGSSGNYFYGYYDNPAWSLHGKLHLCQHVGFWDRLPGAEDTAEVGMIDVMSGKYIALGETTAWNFQQGSMLQWHPRHPDEKVIYNIREQHGFKGVVLNVRNGKRRMLDRPVANVDPTGTYALSINFQRLFDFRPGYGYAGGSDPFQDEMHPEHDGVFLIDLASGCSRLVLSTAEIWHFVKTIYGERDEKLVINHISFNTTGSRVVVLVRNFPRKGESRKTAVVTFRLDGSELCLLSDHPYASHYHWKDAEHLVLYGMGRVGGEWKTGLFEWKDRVGDVKEIDPVFFANDGHCSYSPDRNWLLYDSYPDKENYRKLYLYDLVHRKGVCLGSYYSYPRATNEIRCDLHPRWNRTGDMISFDSTHEGQRSVYAMNVKEIVVGLRE